MVEYDDSDIEELRELAEQKGVDPEWATEQFEETISRYEEQSGGALSDAQLISHAKGATKSDINEKTRTGGGEKMEIDILAIGQRGVMEDWGSDDRDVIYCHAYIHAPIKDDGGQKAAKATLVSFVDADAPLDRNEVLDAFHLGNTMSAVYEVRPDYDNDYFYVGYSTEETSLNQDAETVFDGTEEEKLDALRKAVPEVHLNDITDNLSDYDPESGYSVAFGADVKRFVGTVNDLWRDDEGQRARYTLMDETVTEDDIVDTPLVNERQNVPGLTVWLGSPDHHFNWGKKSVLEIFGVVEADEDQNISMRAAGINPVIPMPLQYDQDADEDVQSTKTSL